jgi:hypothetical protein
VVRSPHSDPYFAQRLGIGARFVTLPGYLGPKSFGRGFYQAEFSDFVLQSEVSGHGAGVDVQSDTLLAGYHTQSMRGGYYRPSGVAATFGVSLRYRFLRSKANSMVQFRQAAALPSPDLSYHVPTRAEQYSALHLPGAAFDWQARLPALEVSLRARAQPSFAGFGAPAFYDYAASHLEQRSKHILHRQGYFYGWGGAYSLAGRMRLGPANVTGHASYAGYVSQQGLDRHIERVTDDVRARGQLLEYGAGVALSPPRLPVSLGLGFDVRSWRSEVAGFERRGRAVAHRLVLGADW